MFGRVSAATSIAAGGCGRVAGALDQPDVAELNGHAVLLEHERPGGRFAEAAGCAVGWIERDVFVDLDAVEHGGGAGGGGLLPGGVEARSFELDVEGLPLQRGAAGADARLDRGAVVEAGVGGAVG